MELLKAGNLRWVALAHPQPIASTRNVTVSANPMIVMIMLVPLGPC